MKRKVRLRRRITIKLYVFFCVRYPQKIFWQWKHRPFTMTCSYNDIISQKHKNRNPFVSELRFLFGGEERIWTLLPKSLKSRGFRRFAPSRVSGHEALGATLLASLKSELSDSAALRYLRLRRSGSKLLRQKEKYGTLEWTCRIFGGEERIWTFAPVTRPTPLAGAPLHHLSTSPYNADRGFVICPIIISSFFSFVNTFITKSQ